MSDRRRGPSLQLRVTTIPMLGISVLAVLFVAAAIYAATSVYAPSTVASSRGVRDLVLCLGLTVLSVNGYLAWPSRWNIPAHAALAFSLVAYILPIFALHSLRSAPTAALNAYVAAISVGAVCAALGTIFGAAVAGLADWGTLLDRLKTYTDTAVELAPRRVLIASWLSIGCMVVAFAVMGFIPALAADPYAAKFFRGQYAAAYAPVAPLYRFATTVITLLLPLITLYMWRLRTWLWIGAFVGCFGAMLLSLQREPALTGILTFIGVVIALRPRGMIGYFVLLLLAYVVGSGLYSFLNVLGLSAFTQSNATATGWLAQISSGSPDVSDQLHFLSAWLSHPAYTEGRTFVGGLIPGNYRWNPAVWSLGIENPTVAVGSINSGGLRLPAPLWGLVSFGWPGVVLVSSFSGLVTGYVTGIARRLIPLYQAEGALILFTIYLALADVAPVFFRLSYLSVIGLVVVLVVFWNRPSRVAERAAAPAVPSAT